MASSRKNYLYASRLPCQVMKHWNQELSIKNAETDTNTRLSSVCLVYRFSCLTRLRLSCGLLHDASQIPDKAPALRELKIHYANMTEPWSDYINSALPQLTLLKLHLAIQMSEALEAAAWTPMSTLR